MRRKLFNAGQSLGQRSHFLRNHCRVSACPPPYLDNHRRNHDATSIFQVMVFSVLASSLSACCWFRAGTFALGCPQGPSAQGFPHVQTRNNNSPTTSVTAINTQYPTANSASHRTSFFRQWSPDARSLCRTPRNLLQGRGGVPARVFLGGQVLRSTTPRPEQVLYRLPTSAAVLHTSGSVSLTPRAVL